MSNENIIFKYPLSSCDCYECKLQLNNSCNIKGIQSNSSIANCNFNTCKLDCSNTKSFNYKQLPSKENGYINLNPDIGPILSRDFYKKTCNNPSKIKVINHNISPMATPPKEVDKYISRDPRLVDQIRGYTMTLDRPPYNSEVPLSETYSKEYLNYGKNYKDYGNIHAGQIMYYYDKSIQQPFFEPVFTINSNVNSYLYKDPMDNYKPYYTHETTNKFNPMIDSDPKNLCRYTSDTKKDTSLTTGLSFIYDTNYHREDIISKQMDLTNRTKYTSRWTL